MKAKMPWLRDRLRMIGETPTGLARELEIAPPRVYEMIGGRRAMQPSEVEPTAAFLKWTVPQLLDHLPTKARVVPFGVGGSDGHRLRNDRERLLYLIFTLDQIRTLASSALTEIEHSRKRQKISPTV